MKTFILTVEQPQGARRRHSIAECQRLGLEPVFVSGCTKTSAEVASAYSRMLNRLLLKRDMTAGEIACYIGHRRLWQAFVDSGEEIALICEDDFQSVDDAQFSDVLEQAADIPDWGILKLFDFSPKEIIRRHQYGSFDVVDYKYPAAGAVAYLLRREVALRMLDRKSIFRPVDEDFLYCWEFGTRVRSIYPNPVAECAESLGGSLLEEDRASLKKRKSMRRSLWGIFLTMHKQLRASFYRKRLF